MTENGQQQQAYAHGADGELRLRTDGSTPGRRYVTREYHVDLTTNQPVVQYRFGGLSVAWASGTTFRHVLVDHLGSGQAELVSGTATAQRRYHAFGADRAIAGQPNVVAEERYTGQRRLDAGNGEPLRELYHYGARCYLPGVGVFTQPDSVVPDWTNPQALNRYGYVLNNPLRFVDPTGRTAAPPPDMRPPTTVSDAVERVTTGLNVTTVARTVAGPLVTVIDRVGTGLRVTTVDRRERPAYIHTDGGLGKTSWVYASDPYEDAKRAELALEYDQPYGTTDGKIRTKLGIRSGPHADFVGQHRERGDWLIAEMKGGEFYHAPPQLENTYRHWRARHPDEEVSFRVYSSRYDELAAGRRFEGYGIDAESKLGWDTEAGFNRETIDGRDVDVRP